MRYRKEIDGLRAFAIIPVIFFHAGLQSFSGGFVGVDVFFVVSGYLIASLIISSISTNTFSLSNFYIRRIRRILPALFLMIIASIPIAWFLFLPNDLKEFSQSMVSVVIFLSNILFWIKSGYFDTSTELKPLIHTWSLSIEEQFYILFPIICIIIFKFSKKNFLLIFSIIALVGLSAAHYASDSHQSMAFYSLPTRGWEIICGVLVAYLLHKTNYLNFKRFHVNQILSLIGFGLVLFSVIIFDLNTPHPSFYTLLPILGTLLLIIFTIEDTYIFKIFTNKYLVGVGLLSYSLYLWHQPIFAFVKYRWIEELSISLIVLIIFISFVLAYFSYHIIESPFRDVKKVSNRTLFTSIGSIGILIFLIGLLGHSTNGFIDRNPPKYLSKNFYYDLQTEETVMGLDGKNCITNIAKFCKVHNGTQGTVLMIGDSHSGDFLNEFKKYAQQNNLNALQLSMGGCSFSPLTFAVNGSECANATKLLQKLIDEKIISKLIFVTNFYQHIELLNEDDTKENLLFISDLFKSALSSDIDVVYFTPRPSLTMNLGRAAMANRLDEVKLQQEKYQSLVYSHLKKYLEPSGLVIYDQRNVLLNAFCVDISVCINGMHLNRPLYRDKSHLSGYGAKFIFQDYKNFE